MSNIISRYKAILPVSLFALSAQGVMAQDATEADTINVAFRKADARDVITPVSTVNVKNLLEKNYNTYSLDNMQALAAGYNGPDSKSGSPHGLVGSNPTRSAIEKSSNHAGFWIFSFLCPLQKSPDFGLFFP